VLLVSIAILGPGAASVDALIAKRPSKVET
jgi:hypothetical protein